MGIYDDMRDALAVEFDESAQGTIVYIEAGATTGDPWNPTTGNAVRHTVRGVGRGVQQKYVDGTLIRATDEQFLIEPFAITPDTEDTLEVDGRVLQIIAVNRIPSAGVVVAWRVFVRA